MLILRAYVVVYILLMMAHLGVSVLRFSLGYDYQMGAFDMFYLDQENNLPTWFSTVLLLSCSGVVASISRHYQGQRFHRHWLGLALAFCFLSLDEAASIHEHLTAPMRGALGIQGSFLYYAWVLPVGVTVIAFGLAYLKFLLTLPRPVALRIVIAGAMFVGGAMGVEMVEGARDASAGQSSMAYALLVALEEGLEMAGALVFLWAIVGFARDEHIPVRLELESTPP